MKKTCTATTVLFVKLSVTAELLPVNCSNWLLAEIYRNEWIWSI